MPKFKNEYGVSKIKYTQKCRCFCPIGKADYTNNFTVTITPKKWIPDYCEIDKFIREQLHGHSISNRILQIGFSTEYLIRLFGSAQFHNNRAMIGCAGNETVSH